MTYLEKADAFSAFLAENGGGASREDSEKGILFFMASESGLSFLVSFSADGGVDISTVVATLRGLRGQGPMMMMGFLRQLNSQALFLKCYLDESGIVAISARVFEAHEFSLKAVLDVLAAVDQQSVKIKVALDQLCSVFKEMGCLDA